jgi:hypothetical protein
MFLPASQYVYTTARILFLSKERDFYLLGGTPAREETVLGEQGERACIRVFMGRLRSKILWKIWLIH